jgi:hypothetical protein
MTETALLYKDKKFTRLNELDRATRNSGSLLILEDSFLMKNLEYIVNSHSSYIIIVINGNKKKLIEKMKSAGLSEKPKKVYVISKKVLDKYKNTIPKLFPFNSNFWDESCSTLFSIIKKTTRNFFIQDYN